MRFLPMILVVLCLIAAVGVRAAEADYYVMADYDLSLDPYDFDVMGASAGYQLPVAMPTYQMPVSSKYQQPIISQPVSSKQQAISNAPITLPVQQATSELIQLPIQTSTNAPINIQPIVNQKVMEQPITQYQLIEQPVIQPRLIEQPKLQQRIVTQPILRQVVTQPVLVPRVTTQPIVNQRIIDQPIIQHRLIERTVVQPQVIEVPVTNKAITSQAIQQQAQPIVNTQRVQAQPIMRQAPTVQTAPIVQPVQQPVSAPSKKGGAQAAAYTLGAQQFGGQQLAPGMQLGGQGFPGAATAGPAQQPIMGGFGVEGMQGPESFGQQGGF